MFIGDLNLLGVLGNSVPKLLHERDLLIAGQGVELRRDFEMRAHCLRLSTRLGSLTTTDSA